jgi:hypothetical protein
MFAYLLVTLVCMAQVHAAVLRLDMWCCCIGVYRCVVQWHGFRDLTALWRCPPEAFRRVVRG